MKETERVARCPSTHCERREECCSPNDCIVKVGDMNFVYVVMKWDKVSKMYVELSGVWNNEKGMEEERKSLRVADVNNRYDYPVFYCDVKT